MKRIIDFFKKLFSKTKSIFYLGSTDISPEPLSKEMEDYYVSLKDDGDLFAKDKLIEHNLRLVAHIVKKFESNNQEIDDLIGIGTVGLIKGIDTYSLDKKVKLTTYAAKCCENATIT